MSGNVGSAISKSGVVENVVLAVGIASAPSFRSEVICSSGFIVWPQMAEIALMGRLGK